MALAFEIEYGPLVLGVMKGVRGWLDKLTTDAELVGLAANGAASISYISSVTSTNITDGTMCTNGFTTTTVNGTFVDKEVTMSLKPSEAGSVYGRPSTLAKIIMRAGDEFYQAQQNAAVAALKAATAISGASITLTTGQVDLTTDGTLGEATDNLRKVSQMVANTMANLTQYMPNDFALCFCPTSAANFLALAQADVHDAKYFRQTNEPGSYLGMSYMGIPIYVVTGATNFGGASKETAFMTCKDSILLARQTPQLHGGGVIAAPDGTYKWITTGPFAYVAIGSHFGEIVNPAS